MAAVTTWSVRIRTARRTFAGCVSAPGSLTAVAGTIVTGKQSPPVTVKSWISSRKPLEITGWEFYMAAKNIGNKKVKIECL